MISQDIISALTPRKYRREFPHDVEEMRRRIESAVAKGVPVHLVGFWGIGDKKHTDMHDVSALISFADMRSRVERIYYPGVRFTFIIADMHAKHNGKPEDACLSYIPGMKELFSNFDCHHVLLSILWDKYNLNLEKIDRFGESGISTTVPTFLLKRAAKHNCRLAAEEAAHRYCVMRQLEKPIIESEFPDAIFHAYSGKEMQFLLPDMPTLYVCVKKGSCECPWFREE